MSTELLGGSGTPAPDVAGVLERAWRAVASFALTGTHEARPGAGPPDAPLAAEVWPRLLARSVDGRISGVLVAAIERGALVATDAQLDEAATAHEVAMARVLRLESTLVPLAARLRAAGIDPIVLKGPAAAHTFVTAPEERDFVDLDLLVRADQIASTVAVLEAAGCERRVPEVRPGFDRRFAKSITLRGPEGDEIDLHRTIAPGPFGQLVDLAALHAHTETFALGGVAHRALDRSGALVHSAYHAALGSTVPRTSTLRDIALLLADPRCSFVEAERRARAWAGDAVLARGIRLAADELALTGDAVTWARAHVASPRAEAWITHALDPLGRSTAAALDTVRALPTWRDRAVYAAMVGVPSRANLTARGASWGGRARHLRYRLLGR